MPKIKNLDLSKVEGSFNIKNNYIKSVRRKEKMKEVKYLAYGLITEPFVSASDVELNFSVIAYDKEIWKGFRNGEYFYVFDNGEVNDYLRSLIVNDDFVKKDSIDISKLDHWDLKNLYQHNNLDIETETELDDYIVVFFSERLKNVE